MVKKDFDEIINAPGLMDEERIKRLREWFGKYEKDYTKAATFCLISAVVDLKYSYGALIAVMKAEKEAASHA
jgi:hypothetical protein